MGEHINVHETEPTTDAIKIGSIVEILYEGDPIEDAERFQVVGWHDEGKTGDVSRTIRDSSELGSAIMDKAAGDKVPFKGPSGDSFTIEILSVTNNEARDTEPTA